MRLSKLYSNKPDVFGPIKFVSGLNVVKAEIRLPENRNKDTHNLGKSTLGRMLDFCFLASRDANFFLFKHGDLFGEFVFLLEIELEDSSYITVRRSVKEASKISFKKHRDKDQDYSSLRDDQWDHCNLPFERARSLLDTLLDWGSFRPWKFRKGLGYLLRSQDDYRDVFQLRKFASKHSDWKPFLAHLLGFNGKLVDLLYLKEKQLEEKQAAESSIKRELRGSVEDISKVEGLFLLKQQEADRKQALLEAFDFRSHDREQTKKLVDQIDGKIAELNVERYSLSHAQRRIQSSLAEDRILFDPDEAERLFKESGVLFQGQIKKDFEQLIAFNRAITEERRAYLQEELSEINAELRSVSEQLSELGLKRSETLSFLSSTDVFNKYKTISDELVMLRADIMSLQRQREFLHRLQELRSEIRILTEERGRLQIQLEADVEQQNSDKDSLFSAIRIHFSDIVEQVIDRKALLSVSTNREGHLEFRAEILDESGNETSAAMGHTYRKLLCIAFDLAVLRAHLDDKFPRFVFHDGVFESLDDRKKENLLSVIRSDVELGVQTVITLIDSDLPTSTGGKTKLFGDDEIVILLHDEGPQGRLFRMKPW